MPMDRFGGTILDAPTNATPDQNVGTSPQVQTDRFGGQLISSGSQSPVDALRGQNSVPNDIDSPSLAAAKGDIAQQESGTQLVKTDNGDGTATYTPQQVSPARKLSDQEKLAIYYAHQNAQNPLGHPAPEQGQLNQAADQSAQQSIAATNSPLQNYANAGAESLAQFGTGIEGVVAPQAAAAQNANIQAAYQVDPNSKAGLAGQLVGTALPLAPGLLGGAAAGAVKLGTDVAFAANAFGNVRATVAQLRSQGQDISTAQELSAAALQAAVAFVATRARFKTAEQYVNGMREGVVKALTQYAQQVGTGAAIGGIQQIANNAINKGLIDGSIPLEQGVAGAAGAGAVLAGISGPAHALGESINGAEHAAAPTPTQPYDLAAGRPTAEPTVSVPPDNGQIPLEAQGTKPTVPLASEPQPGQIPLAPEAQPAKPAEGVNPAASPEAKELPPLLAQKSFKTRVTDGAESKGLNVEFDSPIDKALFAAAQPRQGKVQIEAKSYLADAGLSPEAIERGKAAVMDAVQTHSMSADGDTITVPETYKAPQSLPLASETASEKAQGQIPLEAPPTAESQREPVRVNSPGFSASDNQSANAETGTAPEEVPLQPPEKRAGLPSLDDVKAAVAHGQESVEGFKVAKPQNRDQVDAQNAFRKRGIQIVYYSGEGRGFHSEDHPGILFVNKSNVGDGLREAVAHEFMHELATSRPDLFNEFAKAIPTKERQAFSDWYTKAFQRQRPGEIPARLGEEATTTPFGQLAGKGTATVGERQNPSNFLDDLTWKRVWGAATGEKPGLVQRMLDVYRKFSEGFSTKSKLINTAVKAFEETMANPIQRPEQAESPYALRQAALPPSKEAFLPGAEAGKAFFDDDVKPKAEEALGGIKDAFKGIKNLLGLQSGKEAIAAKGILRERGAELQQRSDRVNAEFDKAGKFLSTLPVDKQRAITDLAERGQKQTDPTIQPVVDAIRAVYDDRLAQLQKQGKLSQFVENYMGHLYEKPDAASQVLADLNRRPLEGSKGFLKQRKIPFQSDAIAAGLTPVTDNPVEMMKLKVHQMDKAITAHDAFQQLDAGGMLKEVTARQGVPDGYAKIDDKIATIYGKPSKKGSIQTDGYVVAPEPVASVINNFLQPGISSDPNFGGLFRGFLGVGNVANQLQLSLSAFHATGMMMNAGVSKLALAGEQARAGKIGAATKSILNAATVIGPVIENYRNGSRLLQEWYKPGTTDAKTTQMADMLKAAGGRPTIQEEYKNQAVEGMKKAFRDGNIFGAAVRAPFAALEKTAAPIMSYLVPRVKTGAFMDLAQLEMDKLGPNASRDQVREAMGRAWNSVESRMGQVTYDNIFANRSVKNLAAAITRAPGWTGGTIAELGGGVKDLATAKLSHRSAYLLALPIFSAYVGGMLNMLMTGQTPQSFKDLYFPRTGKKDDDGHDERFSLPTYMNDAISYAKNPVLTLKHKTSPLINLITEVVQNEDFRGVQIRNPDDSYAKQAEDVGKHIAGAAVPFSASKVSDAFKAGDSAKALLPAIGLNPARRDITHSDAENLASQLMADNRPVGGRTSAAAEKSQLIGTLAHNIQTKQPGAIANVFQAVKAGTLDKDDVEKVREHLQFSPLQISVRHLDAPDAMKVWNAAEPAERVKLGAIVLNKIGSSETLSQSDKLALAKQVRADFKAAKGG